MIKLYLDAMDLTLLVRTQFEPQITIFFEKIHRVIDV